MSNPFSTAAIRREFPRDTFSAIVRANGSISRSAIRERLSAYGCPNANADVAAAIIRAGGEAGEAIQLAMLACYYIDKHGPNTECMDRTFKAIQRAASEKAARMHPRSKWAEDRAARLEGRESRWGTAEFHHAAGEEDGKANVTKHYPYRNPEGERSAPSGPRDGLSNGAA